MDPVELSALFIISYFILINEKLSKTKFICILQNKI